MKYEVAKIEDYGYKNYFRLKKAFSIFGYIVLAITFILMYLSIFVILLQSFNSSLDTNTFKSFTFKWYLEMFSSRSLSQAIINSMIVSLSASLLATILGTLIAFGIHVLNKHKKTKILMLNNIPMLNADIVTGVSLMIIFSLVLPIFPYLFGPATLILAHLFFTLPYVILSVLPKISEVDKHLFEAALDLGIKPYKALIKVMIPAIKTGILAGLVLAFTMSVDDFVISYYTTGNGFDNLSIWIYSSIGRRSLTPSVYAFSSLLTFSVLIILIIYSYLVRRSKHVKR